MAFKFEYMRPIFLEPPAWVVRNAHVDVFCVNDGVWYHGIVKQMGANGKEVIIQISYLGYDGVEQRTLFDCKCFAI